MFQIVKKKNFQYSNPKQYQQCLTGKHKNLNGEKCFGEQKFFLYIG